METGNRKPETGKSSTPDFRRRTFLFAASILRLVESLPDSVTNSVVSRQLIRSATSIGANARAAKRARSRAEFAAKMGIVEEEADESIYWLELFQELKKLSNSTIEPLLREANEILAISVSSIKTAKRNAQTS
jgi:four helix bundle protein